MPDRPDQVRVELADEVAVLAELLHDGAPQAALDRCNELLEIHPNSHQLHNIIGAALAALERGPEALSQIQKAIDLQPAYAPARHNLGLALMQMGEIGHAVASLKRAVILQPDNAAMHIGLGTALAAAGQHAAAISAAKTALALDPGNLTFLKNLAQYLVDDKQHEVALPILQSASNLAPADQDVQVVLGEVYSRLGRANEAIEQFRRAAELNSRDPDLYLRVGEFWRDQKNSQKQFEALERAIAIAPDFVPALLALANAYAEQSDDKKALHYFDHVLKLDPGNSEATHLRAAVRHDTHHQTPQDYVTKLFDDYAPTFEDDLQNHLSYTSPSEMKNFLSAHLPAKGKFAATLDLGCGTGLFGEKFRGKTEQLIGVDLSPKMIAIARKKAIYESLEVGEIVAHILADQRPHDLYVAVDVLIYIGDLGDLFDAIVSRARRSTLFAFTIELLEGSGFQLRRTGRYAHSATYIQTLCAEHGLSIVAAQSSILRKDRGQNIEGNLCLLRVT